MLTGAEPFGDVISSASGCQIRDPQAPNSMPQMFARWYTPNHNEMVAVGILTVAEAPGPRPFAGWRD
jgi:hypothetical protein